MHSLHFLSPSGWSWYFIASFEAFPCAAACRFDNSPAHAAPDTTTKDFNIERRESFAPLSIAIPRSD
jgi:hypothetical protein